MRRRWRGRGGGGWGARAAPPTPMLTSVKQQACRPPVTAPSGQPPRVRRPKGSAGCSHCCFVFSCKSTACLDLGKAWFTHRLNMTLLLQVCSPGLFTLSYSLILPHGSVSSVCCHLYAFQNAPINLTPYMIPAEEAIFRGKETPDQTQGWQGCPSYLSLTRVYPVGFQCGAAAAGLCGDAACPWWKAEEEARGDAEATEGVRGGWGRGLWGRWRRSQGGATGGLGWGPGWRVAVCENHVQTTTTPQNSLLQPNHHHYHQQHHHQQQQQQC